MTLARLPHAALLLTMLALPACHALTGHPESIEAPPWMLDDSDAPRAPRLRSDVYVVPEDTTTLPDVHAMTPVQSIVTNTLDVVPVASARVAVDCRGTFDVASGNVYRFRLAAGDAARLYLDGEPILGSDAAAGAGAIEREVALLGGPHRIRVVYLRGPEAAAPVLEVAPRGRRYAAFQADRPLGHDAPHGSTGESPTATVLRVH